MILFLNDWEKYPNAIIHTKTNNPSALSLASKLRAMGVKNHAFFLSLFDKELEYIDPHSPDLSEDLMYRIGIECQINPWYVLREVIRVPPIAGIDPVKIEFNRSIVSMWWCFFNHITTIYTQPRQTGKSLGADTLMYSLMNFWLVNTKINLLTLNEDLRKTTVSRVKAIGDYLPKYLAFKTKKDLDNTEAITIKKHNNIYTTKVAQPSEAGAYNAGRGITTPILHVDEPPFQPNIQVALNACLPAMNKAIDLARLNGSHYGIIYTTTAGKKDTASGKYFYNIVAKSTKWTENFYDCRDAIQLREIVTANSGAFRIYAEFSHRQLGYTDEWLREKIVEQNLSPDSIDRDYFNIWTSGQSSSPIDLKTLEAINKSVKEVTYTQITPIGGLILNWYIEKNQIYSYMQSNKTILGIDTSDAVGNDGIGFVCIDIITGNTVCTGSFNKINLITFSNLLIWWIETFINSTVIIERRSSGPAIIDHLLTMLPSKKIDPFTRLFNWVIQDPLDHRDKQDELNSTFARRSDDIYNRCKRYFGFATSGSGETSRNELYSGVLQAATKTCFDKVNDKTLVDQLNGLTVRNGRIDHEVKGHDDLVIAWLLCQWFLKNGKNLATYGIDSARILSQTSNRKLESTKDIMIDFKQQLVRSRISELYEKLSCCHDRLLISRYEDELRNLDSKIVLRDDEHFSVDAIINEAKKQNKFIKK